MSTTDTLDLKALLDVLTAVQRGDFSVRFEVEQNGRVGRIADTLNAIIQQNQHLAGELARVGQAVGREGRIDERVEMPGAEGAWLACVRSVNEMVTDVARPLNEVGRVLGAVAKGDLTQHMDLEPGGHLLRGEFLRTGRLVNRMVDQLGAFASEVTRVAREVGTEGQLGGQAEVREVSGTWKDLTESVNSMARNLTAQVRNIAEVTTAVANGDLSKQITVEARGEIAELKHTINRMVDQLNAFASEVTRVAREVGTEGELGGQAEVTGVSGVWKDLTDNVNSMADNLTAQVRSIAEVTTAVANGDLSKKIAVDAKGEIAELKNTVNRMVDQLSSFAAEVTRVAREVGTEGELGGQADVKGVSGVWKDLTEHVNSMADNLTTQVRNIAEVTTAVANGDLSREITVDAKGEIAELKHTINKMVDQLGAFASEVTRVAREVGIEGKLGGQAQVPGASGIWRDLTDNVNRLAANLTTQVRAITEVTTAVAAGDLSKNITVEAAGEVADLKNNVNTMIRNLMETTRKNQEQDWLKTNLTRFTQLLQGQKELIPVAKLILSELAPLVGAQHGVFYLAEQPNGQPELELRLIASYAFRERRTLANRFRLGEGLIGQCALERERILVHDVPGDYIKIASGLGEASPYNLVAIPVLFEGQVKAVVELASFQAFNANHLAFLDQLTESIGIVLNTIEANMRTEALLKQSQQLTEELQEQQEELQETNRRLEQQAHSLQASEELLKQQQEELQQTNRELEEKAQLLSEQKSEVERKNREIELARRAIEEKAEQLALTSKYKSEFLANMSHELRTPLNSMLILSKMLSENREGSLTPKQVEFAQTIHSAGADLLGLINEILDLSKIESGTMSVDLATVALEELRRDVERMFRQVAAEKGLDFRVEIAPGLPEAIQTDGKRLQQVLKNLLSNAFKFTDEGSVTLRIAPVPADHPFRNELLRQARQVVAFSVVDTGVGIPKDKHQVIFEAFQQADGTTSRMFGGTGLGLSISREIARLLGGEIQLESEPGRGSTFTLLLPAVYRPTALGAHAPRSEGTPRPRPAAPEGGAGDGFARSTPPPAPPSRPSPPRSRNGEGAAAARPAERPAGRPEPARAERAPASQAEVASPPASGEAPETAAPEAAAPAPEPPSETAPPPTPERPAAEPAPDDQAATASHPDAFADDRETLTPEDRVLLVVEDDPTFAGLLRDMAREKGFKVIMTPRGEETLELALRYRPSAVTLDVQLPGMHGLAVLDQLKHHPETRHVPVQIVSVADQLPRRRRKGAVAQLQKPVTRASVLDYLNRLDTFAARDVRHLLIVEDDSAQRSSIVELVGGDDVQMTAVGTGSEALVALKTAPFDCAVLDLGLPDMSGFELLRAIRQDLGLGELPVVVYTGKDLSPDEIAELNHLADAVIVKDVQSFDRLLDETALFLHRVDARLPEEKRKRIEAQQQPEASLAGRKVLIVDDDIRNIFALTSLLERFDMEVIYAESGEEGIDLLQQTDDVDAVLMDVMMPGMDGYETTRAIRRVPRFEQLPIIAVTAKAMKGDREKCIEAGASDYITKPVNVEQLLSLLRVWINR